MAGDWQTLSERAVYDVKEEDDSKADSLSIGVRKRQREGEEEEKEAGETVVKKSWGSVVRTYPGAGQDGDGGLDELLRGTLIMARRTHDPTSTADERVLHQNTPNSLDNTSITNAQPGPDEPIIKREELLDTIVLPDATLGMGSGSIPEIKKEDGSEFVFKKRKPKQIRQK